MKSHHYDDARIWSHSAYEAGHEVERLKQTTKLIPPICKKILDVGCGNGVFLRMLEWFKWQRVLQNRDSVERWRILVSSHKLCSRNVDLPY